MPYKNNDNRKKNYKKNKVVFNTKRRDQYKRDEQHRKRIAEASLKRYYENHDESLKRRKELRARPEAKEKVKDCNKKWLDENRELNKKSCKKRYYKNHDYNLKKARQYIAEHPEEKSEYNHKYRELNRDDLLERYRKWKQTENGKRSRANGHHKRRGLGRNEVFPNVFDESEKPVSHHVNQYDYVWIPEDLHLLFLYGKNVKKHRENLDPIVKQLYPDYVWDG